jgi:hypothetical protein
VPAAGLEERVEKVMRVLDGEVQLPAQRADEIHAQGVDIDRQARLDHLRGEPGEGRIVERSVGELREHLA